MLKSLMLVNLLLVTVAWSARFQSGDTVAGVRFEGNRAFRNRMLDGVVATRRGEILFERRLDADAQLLTTVYNDNGFRTAEVDWEVQPAKDRWLVVFNIEEGVRARVHEVRFRGNVTWDSTRLARLVIARPGQHVTATLLPEGEELLAQFYSDNGFPFVVVDGVWQFNDTLAELIYEISEGPLSHIREVRVRGNRRVPTRVIMRTLELEPGRLFSRRQLLEAQRRLYATRLFQRVLYYVVRSDGEPDIALPRFADEPVDTAAVRELEHKTVQPESVVIRYDVVEQPQRGIAFGVGFEAPPLRLLGSVDWQHLNAFKRAHVFETGVDYSPNFAGDYRLGLRLSYRIPYLLGTKVNFSMRPSFHIERVDTALIRDFGVETGASHYLMPRLSVGAFNRLRLVADTASSVTNSIALNLNYDSRDDFFDPNQGVYLRPVVEVAGGMLQGSHDFYRISGEARWFRQLGRRMTADRGGAICVVAARLAAGRTFPYGRTDRVPYFEAFTLGGRDNLRGYPDRSLGPDSTGRREAGGFSYGPMMLNMNLEIRSRYVFNLVGLVLFADGGQVVDTEDGYSFSELEYSAGAGIRVRTPIGPVRLDWGKQLKSSPPGDRGRFYLGLLHAF